MRSTISFFDLSSSALRFRHRIDGLQHLRIGLDGHLLRILIAERRGVHFALQLLLNPDVIVGPVGLGERQILLQQILVKIVDHAVSGSQPFAKWACGCDRTISR